MAKFIVKEIREIVKGFYTESYEVEADSLEEAQEKLENRYDDDSDIEPIDTDFDIRDSDFIRYEND